MGRPPVDVVMPFAGTAAGLEEARSALQTLRLGPGDTATLVDNRPGTAPAAAGTVAARGERSSYFARNCGAELGANPWLLFLDADVRPPADLLDLYFEPPPAAGVAVVAGAISDEDAGPSAGLAQRYAHRIGHMEGRVRIAHGAAAFPRTANCLVLRDAFEHVGGFADGIRSGGDADLWFRLRTAGWALEHRPGARVEHRARASVAHLVGQVLRYGGGAAWVERRHPGSFPRRRRAGLAAWTGRRLGRAAAELLRGDRSEAGMQALEGTLAWADELGRLVPNRARPR